MSGSPRARLTSDAERLASFIIVVVGVTTEAPDGALSVIFSSTSPLDVSMVLASVFATKPTPVIALEMLNEPSFKVRAEGSFSEY